MSVFASSNLISFFVGSSFPWGELTINIAPIESLPPLAANKETNDSTKTYRFMNMKSIMWSLGHMLRVDILAVPFFFPRTFAIPVISPKTNRGSQVSPPIMWPQKWMWIGVPRL